MKTVLASRYVTIPEGIKITVKSRCVEVVGPRGTLNRNFKHLNLDIQHVDDGKKLRVDLWFGSRKQVSTAAALLLDAKPDHLCFAACDFCLRRKRT
jgi:large subunit ribosomal protein L9e